MKKVICLLFLILLLPINIYASDVNYNIEHYYIEADILNNGDLKVTELIILDGTFNGYVRDIVYKNSNLQDSGYESNRIYNASDLEIINIGTKNVKNGDFSLINDEDFNTLNKNQALNGGFIESNITNGKSYKMYSRANKESIAFKLTYLIKDVVVLHNDVAEIYWTFIGNDYEDKINDLQIKINLPLKDNSDKFRIWAHGDLAGEIKKENNQFILANIDKLNAHNSIDIRATFSPSIINRSLITKINNESAFEKIIEVENKRADEANQTRKIMKVKYYLIVVLTGIFFLSIIISGIYIYLKYDKEYKSTFISKYNREFIDEYNVEVIDYLFNKRITPNALSASIMNLIYKKNIHFEEFLNGKKKEYTFYLDNKSNLNASEESLLEFLFEKVGNQEKFTTLELKKYAKGTKTYEDFSKSYKNWENKVILEGLKQDFFEKQIKPKIFGSVYLVFSILINILANIINVNFVGSYFTIFISIIFMIYTFSFTRRTKKGNDHYVKWKAFKRFLNDFGTFDLKELPEITLWERYMVYATIFGLADKVSKVMNVRIKEFESNSIYSGYSPTFIDWYVFNAINDSIVASVRENTATINAARVNSTSSSGSGFGGGFSSGGGFGGGGGGGHGF